jgi:hypothetical protein
MYITLNMFFDWCYIGRIYINVSRTEYNIFKKMMDLQTVLVTANKETVLKNHINCFISWSGVLGILHPNMIVFYWYIAVLLHFSYILGNWLVVWVGIVTHFNFSHLKYWEIGTRLTFLYRTSDFQEWITDVKWKIAVYTAQEINLISWCYWSIKVVV